MTKKENECTKATITKHFLTNVQDRHKTKIHVTPKFATMVTGHGKTMAYFHPFKIMEQATCPFNNGYQTIDHLLYQCTLLLSPRELLRNRVLKIGNWPASKRVNNKTLKCISHIHKFNRF
jgi:hypothetical protein